MKIKKFFTNTYFLISASAVLSALPLTFSWLFAVSWFSFVPFFYTLIYRDKPHFINSVWRGFLFGFIYHACVYYWFLWFYPLDYAELTRGSSAAVVLIAWLGISAVHGLLWCIPTVICHFISKITKNRVFICLTAVLGIIAAEKLMQIGELSFPWTRVSLGQYTASALIQSLSLFGTDGLDMLILGFNALIFGAIFYKNKKRVAAIVAAASIFCLNVGYGILRLNTTESGNSIKVMTVQASVGQYDKWSDDGIEICYNAYKNLTYKYLTEDTDLIIWPESAVPKVYKTQKSLNHYKKISKKTGVPLLAGVLYNSDGVHTNNAMLISADKTVATYSKRQLVPFGEYMPYEKVLSKILPFLKDLNIIEEDYVSGENSAVMSIGEGRVGNIICFESIYPDLSRESVLDGAQLLIETTNDSWLKNSPAMKQHLAHGVFRSIENARPLIRSANSGISAFIDSRGRVQCKLDPLEEGVLSDTVYFSNEKTLYTQTGDILFFIALGGVTVWFLINLIKFYRSKK